MFLWQNPLGSHPVQIQAMTVPPRQIGIYQIGFMRSFLASARKEPKEAVQRGAELIAPAINYAPFEIPRPASP